MSAMQIKLKDLVEYQSGAIVSKEITRKPTGTLTVFAFDAGQGLSEHTAPFDAIVQILDGTGTIYVDQQPHQVAEGELIIMPANHPHALHADVRFKMLLTMIRS
jgi:quercetin dioxygenase-like cupin family protein